MNFYKSAALTLDHLDKHQGSVKGSLTAAGIKSSSSGEAKRILAREPTTSFLNPLTFESVVIETLKCESLETVLSY